MITSIQDILRKNSNFIQKSYEDGVSTCELGRQLKCSNASVYVFLRDELKVPIRKVKSLDDYRDDILRLAGEGLSGYEISQKLQLNSSTFQRYAKKLGLDFSKNSKIRQDPIKNHVDDIIKQYSNGVGCYKLAKQYNCAETSILRLLVDNGIVIRPLRTLVVNEEYFDKIDSWDKAYILGLLYADGNVDKKLTMMRISVTDKELVEYIKTCMKTDVEIKIIQPRQKTHKIQYNLTISSKKLCQALVKLGCVPRKTYCARLPSDEIVPKEFKPAFLLGYSDGDGSIGVYHFAIWQCTSIVDMAKDILMYMGQLNIIGAFNSEYINDDGFEFIKFRFTGQNALKFLNYIYDSHQFCLKRKYDKYLEAKAFLG